MLHRFKWSLVVTTDVTVIPQVDVMWLSSLSSAIASWVVNSILERDDTKIS